MRHGKLTSGPLSVDTTADSLASPGRAALRKSRPTIWSGMDSSRLSSMRFGTGIQDRISSAQADD
jgi:hypothetical protein